MSSHVLLADTSGARSSHIPFALTDHRSSSSPCFSVERVHFTKDDSSAPRLSLRLLLAPDTSHPPCPRPHLFEPKPFPHTASLLVFSLFFAFPIMFPGLLGPHLLSRLLTNWLRECGRSLLPLLYPLAAQGSVPSLFTRSAW